MTYNTLPTYFRSRILQPGNYCQIPVGQTLLTIALPLLSYRVTLSILHLVVSCCHLATAILGPHHCSQNQGALFHSSPLIFSPEPTEENQQFFFQNAVLWLPVHFSMPQEKEL